MEEQTVVSIFLVKVGGNRLLKEFSSMNPQFFLEAFPENDGCSGNVNAILIEA